MERKRDKKKRKAIVYIFVGLIILFVVNLAFIISTTKDEEKDKLAQAEQQAQEKSEWATDEAKSIEEAEEDNPNIINGVRLSEGNDCVYEDEATTQLPSVENIVATKEWLSYVRDELSKYKAPSESYRNIAIAFSVIRSKWGAYDALSVNNPLFLISKSTLPRIKVGDTEISQYADMGDCLNEFYARLDSVGCKDYYMEYEIIDKLFEMDEITEEEKESVMHYVLTYY